MSGIKCINLEEKQISREINKIIFFKRENVNRTLILNIDMQIFSSGKNQIAELLRLLENNAYFLK